MMHPPIPAALAAAFEHKVTITAPELCRLLPLDQKTLRVHIRQGNIEYVQTGLGDTYPRKAFTLAAILRFLEDRRRLEEPPVPRLRASRVANAGWSGGGTLARAIRERAERERQKPEAVEGITALIRQVTEEGRRRRSPEEAQGGREPTGFLAERAKRVAEGRKRKAEAPSAKGI